MKKLVIILLILPVIASGQNLTQERLFSDAWIEHEKYIVAQEVIQTLNNKIADMQKTIDQQAAELKKLKEE